VKRPDEAELTSRVFVAGDPAFFVVDRGAERSAFHGTSYDNGIG
jgi:hypothetical protein